MMQSTHHSATSNAMKSPTPDEKILTDLSTLTDQIALCQSMLSHSTTLDSNEALLQVIGFLEACVPRMVELIEAAAMGDLSESTLEECLSVNDKLTNILGDVERVGEGKPMVSVAKAADGESEIDSVQESMNKLGVAESKPPPPPPATAAVGGKTTGLDDPFAGGVDLLSPTPVTSDPFTGEAVKTEEEDDDDFDAFFRDRTSAAGGF